MNPFEVSIPITLSSDRALVDKRATHATSKALQRPGIVVAVLATTSAALGGLIPAALPMFASLLGVAGLTLLLDWLRRRKWRSQSMQTNDDQSPTFLSIVAIAASYVVVASLVSSFLHFAMQSPLLYADIASLGRFTFVLSHVLFVAAFVVAPRVIRDFYSMREAAIERRNAAQLRVATLERSLAMSELKTLQAQIEPHFLYNVLANVQSMVAHAPATADAMLTHLIDYLKHALPSMRAGESTLRAEFDLARSYLAIAQLRFGDRLTVMVDESVREDVAAFAMPPMLLLPLVENAIKHGVEGKPGAVRVEIDVKLSDEMLTIRVSDDGPGFTQISGSGIGIANVRERLAALYRDSASVNVSPREGGGVVSTLNIPVKEQSAA
ncbi:MAG: sensor histidine kinase [Casimicrobium sp.]